MEKKIGIFGGTFDPIHNGHVAMAKELKVALGLDEMRLLPCHLPPHRQQPGVSSAQRAEMAQLASTECGDLVVDCRELNRETPSYSIDTVIELRKELGDSVSITLCMGMDSLNSLMHWYRWDELPNYCHIAVVARPDCNMPSVDTELGRWIAAKQGSEATIAANAAGSVSHYQLSLLPISATAVRSTLAKDLSPAALLPASVWQYIQEHGLYRLRSQ